MQSLQKVFGRHKDKPKQGGKKGKEAGKPGSNRAPASAAAEDVEGDDDWELLDEEGECTALNPDETGPYAAMFSQKGRVTRQDFESLRTLGVGAQATVLLVRHKRDGKLYALKVLKKKDVVASGRPRDPVRERNIMKGAPQSFLVNMHYCFQSATKLFFVLDYMPGGDLYYYTGEWEGGHFSEPTARYYAAQVYLALQSLHDAGVIYRDLKPENVLLDENGNAKLADFGLSTQVDQKERAQSFVGTAFYIAPEILQNKPYSHAVDWWSFGVLVFNLLTGENPFYGEKLDQIFESILTKGYHVRSCYSISDPAKDLLQRLLQKDEKKRISGTAIRKHPWFQGLDWQAIERREGVAPDWRPPEDMVTAEAAAGMIGKTMADDSFSVKADISKEHQKLFENFTMDNTGAPPQMKNGGTAFDR